MISLSPRAGRFQPGFTDRTETEDAAQREDLIQHIDQMRELTNALAVKGIDNAYCEEFLVILDSLTQAIKESLKSYEEIRLANLPRFMMLLPVVTGAEKPLEGDALAASMKDVIGERERPQAAIPDLDLGAFAPAPPEQQLLSGV